MNNHNISYFDAHCDTLYRCEMDGSGIEMCHLPEAQRAYYAACECLRKNGGHVDLIRGVQYKRYAQFFALFADAAETQDMWGMCQRLYARFVREVQDNKDLICHCRSGAEIDAATAAGKCAAILSVEGADLLECDPARLDTVYNWGVRFLNPVWNRANALSGTNCEDVQRGLSARGYDFIRAMEARDIYADVSHLSDAGFWDLLRITKKPVVASHSNSRALCPHRRNLTDDMFCAIRETGGVVGINLYLNFIGGSSMDMLVRHVEHFLERNGEKTLCIGGDLDGCEALAGGMTGVQDVGKLYMALQQRGYPQTLLDDLFWNNLRTML